MNNDIIILTIEIYIAGVKNRAGFATDRETNTSFKEVERVHDDGI